MRVAPTQTSTSHAHPPPQWHPQSPLGLQSHRGRRHCRPRPQYGSISIHKPNRGGRRKAAAENGAQERARGPPEAPRSFSETTRRFCTPKPRPQGPLTHPLGRVSCWSLPARHLPLTRSRWHRRESLGLQNDRLVQEQTALHPRAAARQRRAPLQRPRKKNPHTPFRAVPS